MQVLDVEEDGGLSESEMGSFRKAIRSKGKGKKMLGTKKMNVRLVVPRKGRTKAPKSDEYMNEDEMTCTRDGNLRGIAKNCSYDINAIYSSLHTSKIWGVRGHKDFVYIFSKQDNYKRETVSTIPLSPKSKPSRKSPFMSSESFSDSLRKDENLDLASMSTEAKNDLIVQKHVFVFSFGALVVWGGNKGTASTLEKMLHPFESDELDLKQRNDNNDNNNLEEKDEEKIPLKRFFASNDPYEDDPYTQLDDMNFRYDIISQLKNDIVSLRSDNVEEKVAVSLAFAQSIKLTIFEEYVSSTFDTTSKYSRCLASTGRILDLLSQKEVSKAVGELFSVKTEISMNAGILDTPDFFWDNDEFEPLYVKSRKYLDIPKRLEVLTKKLAVIGDLLEVLQNQLENEHGNRLEWIIIVLIAIEVFIQVVWGIIIKDVLNLFPRSCKA